MGSASRPFSRSLRRMFSMPMMASSTSTPSATANPPSVMVFSVSPMRSRTATAASNDSGMAVKAIKAARKSRRNRYSTARMSTAATPKDSFKSPSARSMKFAGRCRPGYSVIPRLLSAGSRSASAFSTARVAVNVFAPNWLDIDIITPGLPMTSASPDRSAGANFTSATSRTKMGVLLRTATTA